MTSSLTETCEVMSQEFEKVFTKSNDANPCKLFCSTQQQGSLKHIEVTVEEVEKALKNLKTPSAPGPDGVNSMMLRECASMVCKPLHKLFKDSLTVGGRSKWNH